MATRDSGGQERQTKRTEDAEETQVEATSDVQERVGKLTDDVDALLTTSTRRSRRTPRSS
jgi:ubiquitin-like protein Pup